MINVLVVDDEKPVAGFCQAVLSEAGHSVLVAHSGRDALDRLAEGEFDLVLSDVHMPEISGLDLLRAIAPYNHHPVVVLITGYGTVASAVEAMRCGAYDYILKPISPDELVAVARRVEEERSLREENRLLRFQLASEQEMGGMIGNSPAMVELFAAILRVAPRRHPALITGETGVGKELVARALHRHGANPGGPFVAVDCGAMPPDLLESELFGHVRGAYTGALLERPGLLASAAGGTLFLDEIGELKPDMQARFFRVLQEREFRPVGSEKVRKLEARVVAATDRNIEESVSRGTFRPELYYRLNVYRIDVPPLRARKSDIPHLVGYFARKHGDGRAVVLGHDLTDQLSNYEWPGNVRELENCVLHMLAASESATLRSRHLPLMVRAASPPDSEPEPLLDKAERAAIASALDVHRGNVTAAARRLGISKATLYRKLSRYGLERGPRSKPEEPAPERQVP